MIRILVAFTCMLFLGLGCTVIPAENISHYGYVLEMGGPDEITRWTLSQTDVDNIGDGLNALAHLTVSEVSDEANAARRGFERVHRKLEQGWPGFTGLSKHLLVGDSKNGPLPPAVIERNREHLIRVSYQSLASACRGGDEAQNHSLFLSIKPPETNPGRLEAWVAAAKRIDLARSLTEKRS
jgi:hypothetical protein